MMNWPNRIASCLKMMTKFLSSDILKEAVSSASIWTLRRQVGTLDQVLWIPQSVRPQAKELNLS